MTGYADPRLREQAEKEAAEERWARMPDLQREGMKRLNQSYRELEKERDAWLYGDDPGERLWRRAERG